MVKDLSFMLNHLLIKSADNIKLIGRRMRGAVNKMTDEQTEQNEQKELQENIMAYRLLEAKLDALVKQRDLVASKIMEISTTLDSIDELTKSKEDLLFPIGAEAFTFGKISDAKKIIIGIGMNVAVEKDAESGKKILADRKKELEQALDSIQQETHNVMHGLENLGPKIQKMISKAQADEGEEGGSGVIEGPSFQQQDYDGMSA